MNTHTFSLFFLFLVLQFFFFIYDNIFLRNIIFFCLIYIKVVNIDTTIFVSISKNSLKKYYYLFQVIFLHTICEILLNPSSWILTVTRSRWAQVTPLQVCNTNTPAGIRPRERKSRTTVTSCVADTMDALGASSTAEAVRYSAGVGVGGFDFLLAILAQFSEYNYRIIPG